MTRRPIPISEVSVSIAQLNWAAGFMEGEGSFQLNGRTRKIPSANATQVQLEPLERMCRLFGGRPYKVFEKRDNHNDKWLWCVNGSRAAGVMMTLYPLMSPKRKDQIRIALAGWLSTKPAGKYRMQCPQGHPYSAENTYYRNEGKYRACLTCRRIRTKKQNHKRARTRLRRVVSGG